MAHVVQLIKQNVKTTQHKIMKTIRIFLSFALFALATVSFGQRTYMMERLFPNRNQQVAHLTADRHAANSRIEFWTHDPQGRASKKVSYDIYEAPVVARTLYVEQVEILFEENLQIEAWMIAPFKSKNFEKRLKVESWMTAPFEAGEYIEMESWMYSSWI